jgi:hypothetical protein
MKIGEKPKKKVAEDKMTPTEWRSFVEEVHQKGHDDEFEEGIISSPPESILTLSDF